MKKLNILLFFIALSCSINATTYYVSQPSGNDGFTGLSQATAFKTIQKAANLVNPGDVVLVMNGTYTNPCPTCYAVDVVRGGTVAAWVTFKPLTGHNPLISFNGWAGFKIEPNVSYVEINGFTIRGNNANVTLADALNQPGGCNNPTGTVDPRFNGNGIAGDTYGSTGSHQHHIRIANNTVYECGGSGIGFIQTDYITVENNTVYNNCWYTMSGTSGINFYQNRNHDNAAGYHIIIRNNKSFGNQLFVPWKDGGCNIYDGNGIIIDDGRNTQGGSTNGAYTAKILVANNLCYLNGGGGIHTYLSDNVDILNNTTYHNSISPTPVGEISAESSGNIRIMNNIMIPNTNEPANSYNRNTNLTSDYNCYFNTNTITALGSNDKRVDPQFVDASNADFHLKISSPCRDAGISMVAAFTTDFDGMTRPQGSGFEMGAYELMPILPIELLGFNGNTEGACANANDKRQGDCRNVLSWTTASEINVQNFEIQRMTKENVFETIGTKKAQNQAFSYTFNDNSPLNGINYYRLRTNDLDGSTSFSNTISLNIHVKSKGIKVYPNPTFDVLNIDNADGKKIEIVNTLGQVILTSNQAQVNVQHLNSGVYFVKIGNDLTRFFKR
jgi:parallel beta-helix repeat protein